MKVQRGRNKDGSLKEKRKMEIYKCRLREEAESLDKFKNMDHVVQIVEHFAVSFKDDASGIQRYVWTHNLCLQILHLWLVIPVARDLLHHHCLTIVVSLWCNDMFCNERYCCRYYASSAASAE